MNQKSWTITGAAVALVVAFTMFSYYNAGPGESEGVYRRWYDGTLERTESSYNGLPQSRQYYGDDGETVVRSESYYPAAEGRGKLSRLKVLSEDGKMHTTSFDTQGNLIEEDVENATGKVILKRQFSGKQLISEVILSDDGSTLMSKKNYRADGSPERIAELDSQGVMKYAEYHSNGKIKIRAERALDGSGTEKHFFDDGETLLEEWTLPGKETFIRHLSLKQELLWEVKALVNGPVEVTFYGYVDKPASTDKSAPTDNPAPTEKPTMTRTFTQHYLWYSNGIQMDALTEFGADGKKVRWIEAAGGYLFSIKHFDAEERVNRVYRVNRNRVYEEETFDEKGVSTGTKQFGRKDTPPDFSVERKRLVWPAETRSPNRLPWE